MQGINKTRHEHLVDVLLQTGKFLNRESEYLQQAEEYRTELESMYRDYERMLGELAEHITAYEALCGQVRVQFLGKKLKALKKELLVRGADSKNIHLVYGT